MPLPTVLQEESLAEPTILSVDPVPEQLTYRIIDDGTIHRKKKFRAREGDHLLVMYGAPERELLQGYCGRKEWTSYGGKTVPQKKIRLN